MSISRLGDVSSTEHTFDLCIVGSGAAGLAIAHEFLDTSLKVCVLESGDIDPDDRTDDLHRTENVGLHRKPHEVSRARTLGGSTALWTGRCGIFDAVDYAHRPWVPESGWPIDADELAPYIERAGHLLGLAATVSAAWSLDRLRMAVDDSPLDAQKLLPVVFQFSKHGQDNTPIPAAVRQHVEAEAARLDILMHSGAPRARNVGEYLRERLERSDNVLVVLDATVTSVNCNVRADHVESVSVASGAGYETKISAARTVLACGGLENARLLLDSDQVVKGGVGNQHDAVGRYFADHAFTHLGSFSGDVNPEFRRRLGPRWRGNDRHQTYSMGVRLSPAAQYREGLLNCAVHLFDLGGSMSPIARAAQMMRSIRDGDIGDVDPRSLAALGLDAPAVLHGARDRFLRSQPQLSRPDEVVLACIVEQVPDPDSRITLTQDRDALGRRRARVEWRAGDAEYRTACRMREFIVEEMVRLGCEPPEPPPWLGQGAEGWRSTLYNTSHPSGSTRMSDDPTSGVVDCNQRVHGVDNLYVAGGSVFPTNGYMNPTQMIVMTSLRLADQLRNQPTTSIIKVAEPKPPTRVAIVGGGERIEQQYVPVFAELGHLIKPVALVTRTSTSFDRISRHLEVPRVESIADLGRDVRPDLVIAAVSTDSISSVAAQLVDLGVPFLQETPLAWTTRSAKGVLDATSEGLRVGIAEHLPFMPAEQLKRKVVNLGLLGRVTTASIDMAGYRYHGLAALRAYVPGDRRPVTVSAVTADLPRFGSGSGSSMLDRLTQASISCDDGTLLTYRYSADHVDTELDLPASTAVTGTNGAIVGDTLTMFDRSGLPLRSEFHRREVDGVFAALEVSTGLGVVSWSHPFPGTRLTDEQIAVAQLVMGMSDAAHNGGLGLYTADRAYGDVELMEAIEMSARRGGHPTRLPLRPWADRARMELNKRARTIRPSRRSR